MEHLSYSGDPVLDMRQQLRRDAVAREQERAPLFGGVRHLGHYRGSRLVRHPHDREVHHGVAFVLLLLLPSFGLPRRALSADGSCRDDAPRTDGPRDRNPCHGGEYVDYLYLFYCVHGGDRWPFLKYATLVAWLVMLFYLLTDTAVVRLLLRQPGEPHAPAQPTTDHRRGHTPIARQQRAPHALRHRLLLHRRRDVHRRGAQRHARRHHVRLLGRAWCHRCLPRWPGVCRPPH
ncbi:hypothetical protein SORBI_3004G130700 [Sorghum bicolor]|uniref:Uncharacterized protein n=1 Tax=Sorghum bicolor TaxID=4558 RepID=A0A194YPB1_SORBI|nr:hypothetical protein SORBI_3004G130700 [Sorghum bicolor]